MNKRLLSLLLVLVMVMSIVPTAAFAAVADEDGILVEAPAAEELPQPAAPAVVEDVPAELAAAGDLIPQYSNNVALKKKVYVSNDPSPHKNKAVDGTDSGKIGGEGQWIADMKTEVTENAAQTSAWIVIDLGEREADSDAALITEATPLEKIFIYYNGSNWAQKYRIETAASFDSNNPDNTSWTSLVEVERNPGGTSFVTDTGTSNTIANSTNDCDEITFTSVPALAEGAKVQRYVRMYIEKMNATCPYGDVGIVEFQLLIESDEPENLARRTGVVATCSNTEGAGHTADKAKDGDRTSGTSRWTTAKDTADDAGTTERWLQYDLGGICSIDSVALYWNERNVKHYFIETSLNGTDWTVAHEQVNSTSFPDAAAHIWTGTSTEHADLNVAQARYIRFRATEYDRSAAYADYFNVSVYEFEVYGEYIRDVVTSASVLAGLNLTADSFEINGDKKLVLKDTVQVPDGFTVSFAANLEQVVGADHSVYTPLVDTVVDLDVTVTNDIDSTDTASTAANSPIRVTIPGDPANNAPGTNPKPAVIPEIMEWYSSTADQGNKFTLKTTGRIVHRQGAEGRMDPVANELEADLGDLFGEEYALSHLHKTGDYNSIIAAADQPGDIVIYNVLPGGLQANLDKTRGFDDETYRIEITENRIIIYATDATGAYWATRTILQALKLSYEETGAPTIDCGTIRDYPEFKVRGFILDVGRKPMSMDKLRQIAKNMAWYKMNDFHVHLNDNLIFMEDYYNGQTWQNAYDRINKQAYSAFRLESGLTKEAGALPLAAKDYHYTKAEYKAFVEDSAKIGVNIVSEIDVPAHAKAIVDAFPSVRLRGASGHPWNDHLDLTNNYDASLAVTKKIFDDYINSGVFGSSVHFGADEYYDSHPSYRRYVKDMIDYLNTKDNITTKRVWGSLGPGGDSAMIGTPDQYPLSDINGENIQINIWSMGWAQPAISDYGFSLINCLDGSNYTVPYSGYYHSDGLGDGGYSWDPNNFGGTWVPASSSQMSGGAYAIWNDMIDTRANGVDEQDLFQKFFFTPLPYYACSLWSRSALGSDAMTKAEAKESIDILSYAPNTNPANEVELADGATKVFDYNFIDTADNSGNDRTLTLGGSAQITNGLLHLQGGSSYAETGLDRLSWGSKLSFRVFKLNGGGEEQVIFETDHAYDEYTIKALPVDGDDTKWKLGFSRELYDYEFGVELPVGEWVTLTLTNQERSTKLYVGDSTEGVPAVGAFLSDANSNTPFRGKTGITGSSFSIPVARIGSKTNALVGYVDDVHTGDTFAPSPIEDPENVIPVDQYQAALDGNHHTGDDASKAIDEDASTVWHTEWNAVCPETDGWIQIELKNAQSVGGLRYLPRPTGTNGIIKTFDILVSDDGTTWKTVLENGSFSGTSGWMTASFPAQTTKFVRLLARDTYSDGSYRFVSAAELRLCSSLGDISTAVVTLPSSAELVNGVAKVEVTVTLDGNLLAADRDYTVTYANNTDVGTATVTITGAGGYSGTIVKQFTVTAPPEVEPVDLSSATITFPQESYPLVDGKAEPKPVVKLGDVLLLEGLDYTVSYTDNTRVGTGTATVTAIAPNTGSASAPFQVAAPLVKKNLSDASKTKITLHNNAYPYDGAAVTPEPVVTYAGETLVKDVDYSVSYTNNNAIGTATVTVTGLAPYYEGSASATFTIVDPSTLNDLSNVEKTRVRFDPAEYAYTGREIIPTYTVYYGTTRLDKGVDYTATYRNNVKGGTGLVILEGKGDYYGSFVATFTITGGGSSGGNTGGNTGGSSGSSSGSSSSTTTSKGTDGASVTTRTDASGAMTATATYPNGAKVTADIPVSGPITAVVTVPHSGGKVTVTIPTKEAPSPGHVAVILHPDGTEEIVKTSTPAADGLQLTLDANALIQVVDNTKEFADVPSNSWANDAIAFVTSREIFNGTGNNTFSPNSDMSRAMVCTVLANLAGEDTKAGATWYEKGLTWAKEQGISDVTAPHDIITREQLAAMLYRYAGSPEVTEAVSDSFRDKDAVSAWAEDAVAWAVENGLIQGRGSVDGLDLAPKSTATRAEVAAVLQRFVALIK